MKQAAKREPARAPELMEVEGERVRITGHPDVGRLTIAIGEACEITLGAFEAAQFALLLLNVASTVQREHLGAASHPAPDVGTERVM